MHALAEMFFIALLGFSIWGIWDTLKGQRDDR